MGATSDTSVGHREVVEVLMRTSIRTGIDVNYFLVTRGAYR